MRPSLSQHASRTCLQFGVCYGCYSLYIEVTRYNAKPRKPFGNGHFNTFGRNLEGLFENLASTKKLWCSGFQAFLEVNYETIGNLLLSPRL